MENKLKTETDQAATIAALKAAEAKKALEAQEKAEAKLKAETE